MSMGSQVVMTQSLLSIPGYYLVRCVEAIIFGVFHHEIDNKWQVSMLIGFHSAVTLHLIVFRPYKKCIMQVCEVIASVSECIVLIVICSISFDHSYNDMITITLMSFAYIQAFIGFGYDFFRGIGILYRKASNRFEVSRKKTEQKL